jgi:hypothetical protein
VDPTLVHVTEFAPLFRAGLLSPGPAIFRINDVEDLRIESLMLRPPVGIWYLLVRRIGAPETMSGNDAGGDMAPVGVNMLLLVLLAVLAIGFRDDAQFVADLVERHPRLAGMLRPGGSSGDAMLHGDEIHEVQPMCPTSRGGAESVVDQKSHKRAG